MCNIHSCWCFLANGGGEHIIEAIVLSIFLPCSLFLLLGRSFESVVQQKGLEQKGLVGLLNQSVERVNNWIGGGGEEE